LKFFCLKNTISCGGFGLLIEYLVVSGKAVIFNFVENQRHCEHIKNSGENCAYDFMSRT
jgi:hypothetical protein